MIRIPGVPLDSAHGTIAQDASTGEGSGVPWAGTSTSPIRDTPYRRVAYWSATTLVAAELGLGGIWDIARIPLVRDIVVTRLGYPPYFLVLLGSWKLLGAVALLVPRRALLKEWAYAGAFFVYTGAIVSHLTKDHDSGKIGFLAVTTALTVASWTLRPPSRRVPRVQRPRPKTVAVSGSSDHCQPSRANQMPDPH